jgi:tetratricopeptide (TPR) repeat protein
MTATNDHGTLQAPARRGRWRWALLALLVLGAAAGGAAWKWRRASAPQPPEVPPVEGEPAVVRAIEEARQQVCREPRSGAAWGKLGQVFLAHDFFDAGMVCFEQAQRYDPDNPRWPYLRAAARVQTDPEGALPLLRRAAELCDAHDAGNAVPRLRLAEALLELGRPDEARAEFRGVLGRQPDNPRALYGLGTAAAAAGDLEEAARSFRSCAVSPLARQKAAAELAKVLMRAGDAAGAAAAERSARELPPDRTWPDPYFAELKPLAVNRASQFRRAHDLLNQGRPREAVALLRRLVEERPDATAYQELATGMIRVRDAAAAEAALREAARRDPNAFGPIHLLSFFLYQKAQQARAQPTLRAEALRDAAKFGRQAVALKPDHAMAHVYLGLACKELGQREDALASLRQAVRCMPERPEPYLYLADLLAEDGQKAEAQQLREEASRLAAPNQPQPR